MLKKRKKFCTRCKRTTHNVRNCYAKVFSNGKPIISRKELSKKNKTIFQEKQPEYIPENPNMTNIYVLKLTHNKYYVGKTKNLNNRLLDHFSNNGSVWTKKYKPIKILHIHKNCEPLDEDKYTIKYMSKYGIDNVRGGIYCRMSLNSAEKNIIQRSFKGMNDLCYKCGSKDHFVKDCRQSEEKTVEQRERQPYRQVVSINDALKQLLEMFPTIPLNIIKSNLLQTQNMEKTIDFLILYKKKKEEEKIKKKKNNFVANIFKKLF